MDMHMDATSQRSYLHFGTQDHYGSRLGSHIIWRDSWGMHRPGIARHIISIVVGIRGVLEAEWWRK